MKRELLLLALLTLTFIPSTNAYLLIWGSRSIKTYEGNLPLECIICQNDNLNVYSIRHYFTLFFIPTFPISCKEFYFECQECENCYKPKKDIDIEPSLP